MNSETKLFVGLMGLVGSVAVGITLFMSLRGRRPRAHSDLGGQSTSGTGSFPSPENSESGLKTDENNQQKSRKLRTKGSCKPLVTPVRTEEDDSTAQGQLNDEDEHDNYMDEASSWKLSPLNNPEENKGGEPQSLGLASGTLADTVSSADAELAIPQGRPFDEVTPVHGPTLPNNSEENREEELKNLGLSSGVFADTESPTDARPATIKCNFQVGKGDIEEIELPEDTTIEGFKQKLKERCNVEDIDCISVIFAARKLKKTMPIKSINLQDGDILQVFVFQPEIILLRTAKALRVIQNGDDNEYEYEEEEEEEEEEPRDERTKS